MAVGADSGRDFQFVYGTGRAPERTVRLRAPTAGRCDQWVAALVGGRGIAFHCLSLTFRCLSLTFRCLSLPPIAFH